MIVEWTISVKKVIDTIENSFIVNLLIERDLIQLKDNKLNKLLFNHKNLKININLILSEFCLVVVFGVSVVYIRDGMTSRIIFLPYSETIMNS